MNDQEIFDTVAKHLFAQGQRAMNNGTSTLPGGCAYRGVGGLTCAIGCIIPDDIYRPEFEGNDILGLLDKDLDYDDYTILYIDKLNNYLKDNDREFLSNLQDVHDTADNWSSTETMKEALMDLAVSYELNHSVLDGLSFKDR